MPESENWGWETHDDGVTITDKSHGTEHEFAEGTTELAYLGPFDVCPKDVAEVATDVTGKPVK